MGDLPFEYIYSILKPVVGLNGSFPGFFLVVVYLTLCLSGTLVPRHPTEPGIREHGGGGSVLPPQRGESGNKKEKEKNLETLSGLSFKTNSISNV